MGIRNPQEYRWPDEIFPDWYRRHGAGGLPPQPPADAPFTGVAAMFAEMEAWREAGKHFRDQGQAFEAYAPVADEKSVRLMRPGAQYSAVRLWSLLGALFGGTIAFCMTIWMSMNWPLVVGGKPIVSYPPFIDVCFELTVLYSSFACMFSFFALARIPHLTLAAAYQPEFGLDRFGLYLPCARGEANHLRLQLRERGAEHTWLVFNPWRQRLEMPLPKYEVD